MLPARQAEAVRRQSQVAHKRNLIVEYRAKPEYSADAKLDTLAHGTQLATDRLWR